MPQASMSFWFPFHLWLRVLSMSSCIYWTFVFLLLRTVCLIYLPICWLDYLLFRCLIFLVLYIFWILTPCQMNSLERFLLILQVSSLWQLFSLLCRNFLIWCNPICQFLLLFPELLNSYLKTNCLCIYFEVLPYISLLVLQVLH
jgi:hypothetical protein